MKIIFFIVLISIISLALYPRDFVTLGDTIPFEDKFKHVLAFFTLSFLFYKSFENIKDIYKFLLLIIFACAIEVAQSFIGREASFADIIASISGVLLYLLVSKALRENKCCIKSN